MVKRFGARARAGGTWQERSEFWLGNAANLSDEQLCYAANDVRYLGVRLKLLRCSNEERWEQASFQCLPTIVPLDLAQFKDLFEHWVSAHPHFRSPASPVFVRRQWFQPLTDVHFKEKLNICNVTHRKTSVLIFTWALLMILSLKEQMEFLWTEWFYCCKDAAPPDCNYYFFSFDI